MAMREQDFGMPYSQFGEYLNQHMRRQFLRASHLADELGIHRATVGRWLSGESRPEPELVSRLADRLGLTGKRRVQFLLSWFGEADLA